MKLQMKKIILLVGMAVLSLCLIAASLFIEYTYGRYQGGQLGEDSPYGDELEFIGANQYLVRTPEELIDAIGNGYSYIQIAEDAEKPFVISTGVTGVSANLMLDLNGTQIIRNSRNPILDIGDGISVVLMYDTKGGGALYNPVGSTLQVSGTQTGGRMTVASGSYESGPRAGEYDTAATPTGGTLSGIVSVNVHVRGETYTNGYPSSGEVARTNGDNYNTVTTASMPRLTMGEQAQSGNYFFSAASANNAFLPADTFLFYSEERNAYEQDGRLYVGNNPLAVLCDVASCDFYYYYPVNGRAGTEEAPQTYAVVYGYWDVTKLAETEDTALTEAANGTQLEWPYAAVRMVDDRGEGYIRGGTFFNHFEQKNTYGIYTEGGFLSVAGGTNTSGAEITAFTTGGNGVCIRCAGNGDLDISGGFFSSELGDTIQMAGGIMTVTAGTFNKDVTGSSLQENGAAIDIAGGALIIDGTETGGTKSVQFNIAGSNVNGIHTEKSAEPIEEDFITNASFNFDSAGASNNVGIHAEDGITTAEACTFTLSGSNNRGIDATGGKTTATGCTISVTGTTANFGIRMEQSGTDAGSVTTEGCIISVEGTSSSGIYTTGGELTVSGGSVQITQPEGDTLSSTAVSTVGGNIGLSGTLNILSNALGITAQGGIGGTGQIRALADADITLAQSINGNTITPMRATGIYVNNGSLSVASGGVLNVYVTIDIRLSWSDNIVVNQNNAVYVQGGSLISNGTLNVTFTGLENDNRYYGGGTSYLDQVIKSHAVRVEGDENTNVTIAAGTITNSVGGGVYVGGGTVTLGNENTSTGPTVETTGTALYSGYITVGENSEGNWQYRWAQTGGNAVEVDGGNLSVYGGEYTSHQGNGILVRNSNTQSAAQTVTNIYDGTFIGNDNYFANGTSNGLVAGSAASYAFKTYAGVTNIYGGTFGLGTGNGNGAFAMGNGGNVSTVNVYSATILAGGASAFVAWKDTRVLFDPYCAAGALPGTTVGRTLRVSGASTGLALDGFNAGAGGGAQVTINGGTFTGGTYSYGEGDHSINGEGGQRSAIWYGSSPAQITITNGFFYGTDSYSGANVRSGLDIYSSVGNHTNDQNETVGNIQISGGTFEGATSAIHYRATAAHQDGLVITGGTFTGDQAGLYLATNPSQTQGGWPNQTTVWNISLRGGIFNVTNPSSTYRAIGIADNLRNSVGLQSLFATHSNGAVGQRYNFRITYTNNYAGGNVTWRYNRDQNEWDAYNANNNFLDIGETHVWPVQHVTSTWDHYAQSLEVTGQAT